MSKHTPGPWKAERSDPESGHEVYFYPGEGHWFISMGSDPEDEGFGHEAFMSAAGEDSAEAQEQAKANALLIAAAPDLLAALKEVLDWGHDEGMNGACPQECRACIAKEAIAKAEGS